MSFFSQLSRSQRLLVQAAAAKTYADDKGVSIDNALKEVQLSVANLIASPSTPPPPLPVLPSTPRKVKRKLTVAEREEKTQQKKDEKRKKKLAGEGLDTTLPDWLQKEEEEKAKAEERKKKKEQKKKAQLSFHVPSDDDGGGSEQAVDENQQPVADVEQQAVPLAELVLGGGVGDNTTVVFNKSGQPLLQASLADLNHVILKHASKSSFAMHKGRLLLHTAAELLELVA